MEYFSDELTGYDLFGGADGDADALVELTISAQVQKVALEAMAGKKGAIGVYKPLVEFAGAGATVPLTGFGYLISEGVRDAVNERGAIGIFTGALTAAAGGTAAALIFGFLASIFFKSKPK